MEHPAPATRTVQDQLWEVRGLRQVRHLVVHVLTYGLAIVRRSRLYCVIVVTSIFVLFAFLSMLRSGHAASGGSYALGAAGNFSMAMSGLFMWVVALIVQVTPSIVLLIWRLATKRKGPFTAAIRYYFWSGLPFQAQAWGLGPSIGIQCTLPDLLLYLGFVKAHELLQRFPSRADAR